MKTLKGKFTPKFLKLKNKEGKHVPLIDKAPTIAEYLEIEHWTNSMDGIPSINRQIILENLEFKTEDFDLEELNAALKSTNLNKEPRPDLVRMELLRWHFARAPQQIVEN